MATLMRDEQARMVFTDPPYNVPIDGHVGGSGKTKHREFAMASGEMSSEEFTGFLQRAFERLAEHSVDGSILCLLFIHPPAHGSEVSPAARNTLDSARIPRASKLLICGLFLKGRVLAQNEVRSRGG